MCGIFGEFLFSYVEKDLNDHIKRLNLLKHRGPDGYGFEYGNFDQNIYSLHHSVRCPLTTSCNMTFNYFLGHRRLSIIDLSDTAFQPMEDYDRRFSIVFNGEIYNYLELREELIKVGAHFKTAHSDTEVLLNSYIYWGEMCLAKLRGMFAFLIFDRANRKIFFARDRIGQKTFYYELNSTRLQFASEIAPLLKNGSYYSVNQKALNLYLSLGYIPHPLTFFSGIVKLPPASYAVCDLCSKQIKVNKFWDIDGYEDVNISESYVIDQTDKLLTKSVCYRLRSDVPVGAFISGGIDSTLIIKKIHEVGQKNFDIFGADFPQVNMSEKEYIEEAAQRYSLKLNLLMIDTENAKSIKDIISVFDEPFDGGSSIALYELFRTVNQYYNYKVILTGDGGDEIFAGYERYLTFLRNYRLLAYIKKINWMKRFVGLLGTSNFFKKKLFSLQQFLERDFVTTYLMFNTEWALPALLRDEIGYTFYSFDIFDKVRKEIAEKKLSIIKALQYIEMNSILPGRMLYKLDRFSMRFGIEARSPFLDHKLIEFAFMVPDALKICGHNPKAILKKLLEKDFSQKFVYRKKQGFGNPLSVWFEKDNRKNIFCRLCDPKSYVFNFLNYTKLHAVFPSIKNAKKGDEKLLWRLLVLSEFLEIHKKTLTI